VNVAVCCSVLQRVAEYCCAFLMNWVRECCSVLQRVAACCSVLQRVAACCRVLLCIAMCCNAFTEIDFNGLSAIAKEPRCVNVLVCCSVLQCLKCVGVCYSVLSGGLVSAPRDFHGLCALAKTLSS